jgi:hypothetical protein
VDINGLIYLLNQAGNALAEANQRIAALMEENRALKVPTEPETSQ